jgi:toxin ParE1/3/4
MLRWTERAVTDLIAIGEYIAADNPGAARAWLERLRLTAMKASTLPRAGRIVPEVARDDVREVFHRSYRIVYRIVDDGIVVLTVFEGHRLLGALDPDEG